jgi:hypothetical protein
MSDPHEIRPPSYKWALWVMAFGLALIMGLIGYINQAALEW